MRFLVCLFLTLASTAWAESSCVAALSPRTDCRFFNGYKPCGKNAECSSRCGEYRSMGEKILLVHLGALGAVVRSTALIAAIRRQHPNAVITWLTDAPAQLLLQNNPDIDRVLTLHGEDFLRLMALRFDLALVVDKSMVVGGILRQLDVKEVRGFKTDPENGAIVPANPEADELWRLGLSDHQKFKVNQKTELQLTHEALNLGTYEHDDYQIYLSSAEQAEAAKRRETWSESGRKKIVGLNTGCSVGLVPYKKLTVKGHRSLIKYLQADARFGGVNFVLLGGREDTERNHQIQNGLNVFASPTTDGLRDGLTSVAATDVVFSGDSLGMHMAIGLKRRVVGWFGPTCAHEIEFFGRGEAVLSQATCGPCFKRSCDKPVMCYDQVNFAQVADALANQLTH